jgi:hypothetical protein
LDSLNLQNLQFSKKKSSFLQVSPPQTKVFHNIIISHCRLRGFTNIRCWVCYATKYKLLKSQLTSNFK